MAQKQVKRLSKTLRSSLIIIVVVLFLLIFLIQRIYHDTLERHINSTTSTNVKIIDTPTVIPTPTLGTGQKTVYTFYIQATSEQINNKAISLQRSDTGKNFIVGIGTIIIIGFGSGDSQIQFTSPSNIFEVPQGIVHLPENASGLFKIIHEGSGTITVAEASAK